MTLIRFIGASIIVLIAVSFASLIWPVVTDQPRPQILTQVRDYVIRTPYGFRAAAVLGVSDERNVTKMSLGSILSGAAGNAVSAIEKKAQEAVAQRVADQLSRQFEQLPTAEKTRLQQIICSPQ
jgi:hypothetical protein